MRGGGGGGGLKEDKERDIGIAGVDLERASEP